MSQNLKVYTLGGSRNIGYYTSVRLLQKGATVTFLLRNEHTFDEDAELRPFIQSGHARVVKGDALNEDDVRRGWARAADPADDGVDVDVLLFTIGGIPKFSLTKGFVQSPPDLVTRALLIALSTAPTPPPARIVALTSIGLSPESHAALPLPLRALYGTALRQPHADKIGVEEILAHVRGADVRVQADRKHVLPDGWDARPSAALVDGALADNVVVVRPTLLTDGECRADALTAGKGKDKDSAAYRVRVEGDLPVKGGYTISRRDVSHFIAERLLQNEWDTYKGKGVSLAY